MKNPRRVSPNWWERMEAYLNSNTHLLEASGRKIADILLKQFPDYPGNKARLRETAEVRGFVLRLQAIRNADKIHVADKLEQMEAGERGGNPAHFSKIPYSDTEFTESEHKATFRGTYDTSQFDSPEAYIASKSVDLEKWQVKELGLKTYQGYIKNAEEQIEVVTLNSVFATFKPREKDIKEANIKALFEEFKAYQPPANLIQYAFAQEENTAIINLFDSHIDKVCLISETGHGSTIEDNVQELERMFDKLLAHAAHYSPELIIIPVGNDFFNTNGPQNTTKKGTPQATAQQSHETFITGSKVIRRFIDKAKSIAKVYVPIIKGNHDEDKDFYLGQVLAAVFESDENVEIDTTRKQRKYLKYGINLFAFAHGDKEARKIQQLPLLMAEEQKQAWAETSFRYFFLGDKHHTMEYQFLRAKDFVGCLVKFLRSVGTTDEWHYDNGFIGIPRTGEVEIHAKAGGMIGHHFAHAQYRSGKST